MKIIAKKELKALMKQYPNGGIVFADYTPSVYTSDIMVTNGSFGATDITPHEGEIFNWDWSINECSDEDQFVLFDNNDVLQMIQTLTKGLKIDLEYTWGMN